MNRYALRIVTRSLMVAAFVPLIASSYVMNDQS